MVNTKYPTRSSDRNDVITNVPAIISTSASPTDIVPPNPMTNLVAPMATKRHGRVLQKASGGEPLSIEIDIKSIPHELSLNQQTSQPTHTKSEDLAYCTKCGGLTTYDKRNLTKKRYFSLDKERNDRTANFLQCIAMNRIDTPKGSVSDNLLSHSRKQCSIDGGTSEKSFGRTSNSNVNSGRATKQSSDASNQVKNSTSASMKKISGSSTHRDCTTSFSNRSLKDKSNKSSQNSLREPRTSRKNSIFHFGSSDRDTSTKSKRVSQQYSRKASTRGPINLHEEQDSETREILLGGTSHAKNVLEIKIPEPVEAVRWEFSFFLLVAYLRSSFQRGFSGPWLHLLITVFAALFFFLSVEAFGEACFILWQCQPYAYQNDR